MNSNDKYNMLVNEISKSKNENIKPESFGLDYQEFKSIIDEIENDGLFEKGFWALAGFYIYTGLTFKGRNFLENNDKKEYTKIERKEVNNHTHININHDNNGNIIVGDYNKIKSAYEIKFDNLIDSISKSNLDDKLKIIDKLKENKNDKEVIHKYLGSLLSRGAELGSITSAIGAFFS